MDTTNPYPPPDSPHEEVEKDNLQPPIAGSPSALLPVDDVAHTESITPSLIASPEKLVRHRERPELGDGDVQLKIENRQPEMAGSLSREFVLSPALVVADVEHHHHQELFDSISPDLIPSPESLVDRQIQPPPEDGKDQQEPAVTCSPPEDGISDVKQSPPVSHLPTSPPSAEADHPSENRGANRESPSPETDYPPESPLIKQPPSPSSSPSPPPTEAEYQSENLCPNHESLSLSSAAAEADYPPKNLHHESLAEDFSPNREIPLSNQPPPSSSSIPPTEAEFPPENHESTISKPPPSPSHLPTGAEESLESPNYHINPNSDHESPSSPVELQRNPSPKLKQSPKYLSPSPPHDSDETPKPNTRTPPLGVPLLLHAAATFSPTKPQISPWTHQETANLIQAYQEKWYSLKKGPLKAGQWEEVAITVAARCGYDEPTKTSKQCRHKIEKLRKRYRTERGKPRSKATAWIFFKLMDNLVKGPLPISSSQPTELVEYQNKKRKNEVYDEEDDQNPEFLANKKSRNSNHHVSNGGLAANLGFSEGGNRIVRGLRTPVIHKRKGVFQEHEEENNENVCEEDDIALQLAAEIKGFAEKFVKMENKKIEMMRDVERYRLEMETKRMEMIIESQQMLIETVNDAFGSSVKTHRLSAS